MKHLVVGSRRRAGAIAVAGLVAIVSSSSTGSAAARRNGGSRSADSASAGNVASAAVPSMTLPERDSLFGRSGKRLFGLAEVGRRLQIGALQRLFGDSAFRTPGVFSANRATAGRPFSLIAMLPFSAKVNGSIGGYRIGYWPAEQGKRVRTAMYENPRGFIEVTRENQDTQISEHFRLRDFLTHDQQDVWPKYLVLREDLVDKLELVIDELEAEGIPVQHVQVMSGFRTPLYNKEGGDPSGRASSSRHQYGDAADIFVDNDGDGRMDDLNHDGRIDAKDAQVIEDAAERVERRYGELVGGIGVYRATDAHGPFAHVDVRGYRARWGRA